MKPKTIMWGVIALAAVAVAVFAFRPASGGGINNVDAAGVKEAAAADAQIIDVRTPGEFQMGHIPGAINVPVEQVETSAQAWDRDGAYVVYCATGSRSQTAVQTMEALGFKNIDHFAAGIQAWDGELEQGDTSQSQKVETAGKPVFIEFFTDA